MQAEPLGEYRRLMPSWPHQRRQKRRSRDAFTNPGGVRTEHSEERGRRRDLRRCIRSQAVPESAGDAALTGMQIKDMLEQQWLDPKRPRVCRFRRASTMHDNAKPWRPHHSRSHVTETGNASIPRPAIA